MDLALYRVLTVSASDADAGLHARRDEGMGIAIGAGRQWNLAGQ